MAWAWRVGPHSIRVRDGIHDAPRRPSYHSKGTSARLGLGKRPASMTPLRVDTLLGFRKSFVLGQGGVFSVAADAEGHGSKHEHGASLISSSFTCTGVSVYREECMESYASQCEAVNTLPERHKR